MQWYISVLAQSSLDEISLTLKDRPPRAGEYLYLPVFISSGSSVYSFFSQNHIVTAQPLPFLLSRRSYPYTREPILWSRLVGLVFLTRLPVSE